MKLVGPVSERKHSIPVWYQPGIDEVVEPEHPSNGFRQLAISCLASQEGPIKCEKSTRSARRYASRMADVLAVNAFGGRPGRTTRKTSRSSPRVLRYRSRRTALCSCAVSIVNNPRFQDQVAASSRCVAERFSTGQDNGAGETSGVLSCRIGIPTALANSAGSTSIDR